jgi:PLP dependent protein
MPVAENLAAIRERIAAAAHRARRPPEEITLIAVSKTSPPESIHQAYEAGQRLFGESRVQEFVAKSPAIQNLPDARWHMIGHLQSNKAAKAVELFDAIDSVDSLRLAERVNEAAQRAGTTIPILIEINVGGEAAKTGLAPDSPELEQILQAAPRLHCLQIRGLMTVPPFTEDPEGARPYFRRLRELRQTITVRKLPGIGLGTLSMGMSHDFEIAIEEGSTCVRVGTAIFGKRS